VHEADRAPPSVSKVKNSWSCTSTQPYAFTAWCLIKDMTTLPLIVPLFAYSKSEEDVYAYFGAHEVMFTQIYEVRTIYRYQ
jgi:hypothetical protein